MLHLITCHGRIMPHLAELLLLYGHAQPLNCVFAGAVECISLKRAFVLFLLVLHCHEKCVFCSFLLLLLPYYYYYCICCIVIK